MSRETMEKALRRAFDLGQRYCLDAYSEFYSANKRADRWLANFNALIEQTCTALAQPEAQPVAWYVERVAPAFMDHGRRQGPYWSKDVAESYVDERHVLRPLYAVTLPPAAQPKPVESTNSTAHVAPTNATWEPNR